MPDWLGFSTVERWSKDNAGATDCSAKCHVCEKKWHDIMLEGRGDESIEMLELPIGERTPCGLPYKFLCHTCYLDSAII